MIEGTELVVLDMAGTTVRDDGLVEQAFEDAFRETGIVPGTESHERARRHVKETMGQSKIEVLRSLHPADEQRAQLGNSAFERGYDALATECCEPIEGAERAVRSLRESGVRSCLTTGFAKRTRQRLLRHGSA